MDAGLKYLNEGGTTRTASSRKTKIYMLRQLAQMYPHLELHQYRTDDLTKFCLHGSPSDNTIKTRRSVVRSFFEWASYQKLVEGNPAADLKFTVKPGSQPVTIHNWLTEQQVAHAVASCPTTPSGRRARLLVMIGFMTGLRLHEITNLRWQDLSNDMSRLTGLGKGRKLFVIGIPPQLRDALKAWRAEAPLHATAIFPAMHVNRFGEWGDPDWCTPIGRFGVRTMVQAVNRWSGLTFAPHDMRRTFAGILESKGVDVRDIQRLLRHESVATTERYLEKNPHKTAALADVFTIAL